MDSLDSLDGSNDASALSSSDYDPIAARIGASAGMNASDPSALVKNAFDTLNQGTKAHGLDFNTMYEVAKPLLQAQHFGANPMPNQQGSGHTPIQSGEMKGGIGLGGVLSIAAAL